MKEFQFRQTTFVAKIWNGMVVYRAKDHLGGAWIKAWESINNGSLNSEFRNKLQQTTVELHKENNIPIL